MYCMSYFRFITYHFNIYSKTSVTVAEWLEILPYMSSSYWDLSWIFVIVFKHFRPPFFSITVKLFTDWSISSEIYYNIV
jgi:hypothetical protein